VKIVFDTAEGSDMRLVLVAATIVTVLAWLRLREEIVASRFGALGDLRTRTKAELLGAVGAPRARAGLAGGGEVLDWRAGALHVVVMFDAAGRCVGVSRSTR
jgi:hypothetical protein